MPSPIKGGGGSTSRKLMYGITGPSNTILIGNVIDDSTRFHATGESLPVLNIESGGCGNPRGPVVPKRVVETNKNTKPDSRNRTTNCLRDVRMRTLEYAIYSHFAQEKTTLTSGCAPAHTINDQLLQCFRLFNDRIAFKMILISARLMFSATGSPKRSIMA